CHARREQDCVVCALQGRYFPLDRLDGWVTVTSIFLSAVDAIAPRFVLHEVDQVLGIREGIGCRLNNRHRDSLMSTLTIVAAVNRKCIDTLLMLVDAVTVWFSLHVKKLHAS